MLAQPTWNADADSRILNHSFLKLRALDVVPSTTSHINENYLKFSHPFSSYHTSLLLPPTLIWSKQNVLVTRKSRGGAVVSTPDPIQSLYSLVHTIHSLQDREVVGSNPTHGAYYSFWLCLMYKAVWYFLVMKSHYIWLCICISPLE